jgi:hypothetical protein
MGGGERTTKRTNTSRLTKITTTSPLTRINPIISKSFGIGLARCEMGRAISGRAIAGKRSTPSSGGKMFQFEDNTHTDEHSLHEGFLKV